VLDCDCQETCYAHVLTPEVGKCMPSLQMLFQPADALSYCMCIRNLGCGYAEQSHGHVLLRQNWCWKTAGFLPYLVLYCSCAAAGLQETCFAS
jgi:hypothetical protein